MKVVSHRVRIKFNCRLSFQQAEHGRIQKWASLPKKAEEQRARRRSAKWSDA